MTETLKLDSAQQTKIRSMIADEQWRWKNSERTGAVSAAEGRVEAAVDGAAEGGAEEAVGAGVVVVVARLPIAQAAVREGEDRPRCAPSGIAPTSKSKRFSTRSS